MNNGICLLSELGFSGFQDKSLYFNVPSQKVVLHPLQRNIYSPTPNPGNLVILSILVQTTSDSDREESLN